MNFTRKDWMWLAAAAVAIILLGLRVSSQPHRGAAAAAVLTATRVIQLPVSYIENGDVPRDRLALSAGAEDELPDGPASFDVTPDGGVVLTDPLKQRLVYFSSEGRFVKDVALSFRPRQVWLADNGTPRVEAAGGMWLEPTGDGQARETGFQPDAPKPDSARRTGPDRGFVLGDAPGMAEKAGFPVLVPEGLASIEKLGRDAKGRVYVALEEPIPGDEIDVRKVIRKYAADGTLLAEIRDVPLDYFVDPVREFRIKSDGKVYQLVPRQNLVAINVWDTSVVP
ncbi:MAG TPA: hypothetical protein VME43_13535 [Bryobacteraceae bacterium]|nr:hypothetical protein [Bryobacteraceae bacterium]